MRSKNSARAFSLVAFLPLLFLPSVLPGQSVQDNLVPLKNWAAPLYWQPNQAERAERESAVGIAPKLQFSASQVSASALTFVAVTPCRLVDTRGVPAGFNGLSPFSGPSLAPSTTVTFPVQSAAEATADTTPTPCGTIPSIAQAYSFNITVIPKTAGGVAFLTVWPSGSTQPAVSTLNDGGGLILANAAIVPAGAPSGGVSVFNSGPATTDLIIDMNGFYAAPSDLSGNTAVGSGALVSNIAANASGIFNTAIGVNALSNNTTGLQNTAVGKAALQANTTGASNTADGVGALANNTTGGNNTASGVLALVTNGTGSANVAYGVGALQSNTTGNDNAATGTDALQSNTTGTGNTATGYMALSSNTTASGNTANGFFALSANTTGGGNTATGTSTLQSNTTGNDNTANGYLALQNNTTGNANTAQGFDALQFNTSGFSNTAGGAFALQSNTTGSANTAQGEFALNSNTTGTNNTAQGVEALDANIIGSRNTAQGANALESSTGNDNSAAGASALFSNTTGSQNTAVGSSALYFNASGNGNIAIGYQAGYGVTGSNNIHIGAQGAPGDSGTIRIGTPSIQTSFLVAGVSNVNLGGDSNAVGVLIDTTTGQLGIASSSRRYKEDINDMGEASRDLMRLRPVTFRYKKPLADGSKPIQYGLIAEEVNEVYPDLVAHSADGQIETVKYQVLDSMLLNEVQRQQAEIGAQREQLQKLEQRLNAQTQENASLLERLDKLEAMLGAVSRASGVAAVR
jgi:hypothetical protein